MKVKILLFSILLLATGLASFASTPEYSDVSDRDKNFVTRTYKVSEFDKIDISLVADMYYIQSSDGTSSVKAYGPDNVISLIEASIKNNTLYLSAKKKLSARKGEKIIITVSSPQLHSIKSTGVGDMFIEDVIESSSLELKNQGVGNIVAKDIKCDNLTVISSGVGHVRLKGRAVNASFVCDGVGNIDAEALKGENVKASARGVGNISCYAVNSIDAQVGGIGNITYWGNPKGKKLTKSGIGSIKSK